MIPAILNDIILTINPITAIVLITLTTDIKIPILANINEIIGAKIRLSINKPI